MLQGVLDLGRGGTFQSRTERDIVVRTSLARLEQLDIGDQALYFGRIDRLPEPGDSDGSDGPRWASRSTSAAWPSRARTTSRWSSTGAPRWPSRSTGQPASTRRGWPGAGISPCVAGPCSAWRTSTSSTPTAGAGTLARRRTDQAGDRGGSACSPTDWSSAARARSSPPSVRPGPATWATSSAPSSASRTRSSAPRWPASSWSRAVPAPARRPWRCTGPPTSSTPTASRSSARACSSSARTRCSCATSSRSSPRWARPASASRRWRDSCPRCACAASTTRPWPS